MGKKSQPQPTVRLYTLSSGDVAVLPNESMEDLEQIAGNLNEQFQPTTPSEQFLVDQMIHAEWKIIRYRRIETLAYSQLVEHGDGTDWAVIRALRNGNPVLEKLERLAAAAGRARSQAIRELTQLRAQAQKAEKQAKAAEKQNKAKAADEWLQGELAKIQNEPIFDPYIHGGHDPEDLSVQNEPNSGPDAPPEPQP